MKCVWRMVVTGLLLPVVVLSGSAVGAATIDKAEKAVVIGATAELLQSRYVDAAKGRVVADALRRDAALDAFAGQRSPDDFAQALTNRLRELTGDGHLHVHHQEVSTRTVGPKDLAAFNAAELNKYYGPDVNHGIAAVSFLPGAVGYLDLRVFAPPAMAGDTLVAAMAVLANSRALIIDLRANGGGFSETTQLLAGYLLEAPRGMSGTYHRPSGRTSTASSPAWVPGRRFGESKPAYILTSRRTFSAAEAFAYDLQALGRVTVVGERSGGGAHPYENRRLTDRFVLALPESRSVNPVTGSNWEGVGVAPDVSVPPDQAMDVALDLARKALATSSSQ